MNLKITGQHAELISKWIDRIEITDEVKFFVDFVMDLVSATIIEAK